jgi:hypothetical protein
MSRIFVNVQQISEKWIASIFYPEAGLSMFRRNFRIHA